MNTRKTYRTETLEAGGLRFVIHTKDVRRLSMRCDASGCIQVSVPRGTSPAQIERFINSGLDWARRATSLSRERFRPDKPLTEHEKMAFRELATRVLAECESRMSLKAGRLTLREMTSRWGSCNPSSRHITLNYHLARRPAECLEYVIIHELAHIVHPNHSSDFWNLVASFCPDFNKLRRKLNGRG